MKKAYCACSPDCPIPATTDAQCEHYRTTLQACKCLDFHDPRRPLHRPTWRDPISGAAICKHTHHKRVRIEQPAPVPASLQDAVTELAVSLGWEDVDDGWRPWHASPVLPAPDLGPLPGNVSTCPPPRRVGLPQLALIHKPAPVCRLLVG
jgi:hypothetical protein